MAELATAQPTDLAAATAQGPLAFLQNPVVRQLGVMVAIAASVALGVAVVLWSQAPSFSILAGNMTQKDSLEIVDVLTKSNIEYRIDGTTGAVMVPSGKLSDAKLKLASVGLPKTSDGLGFELLEKERSFGTSRMVEAARYQKATEVELARTIATINSVESARVHLATPKRSVFVEPKKAVSASVAVKLYPGRVLDPGQVESIIHLVASSVPELEAANVTVVDQKGNLLSGRQDDRALMMSTRNFEYTTQLEENFKRRVEDILIPVVGQDRVRAQVTADLDFTQAEQTEERFNPDGQALRSEQTSEQQSNGGGAGGVPGALSNQPPAAGTAPEQAGGAGGAGGGGGAGSSSKNATRNFEVDKTISHSRTALGQIRKLSVAVVVDDRILPGKEEGQISRIPRTPEEIERITALVREAMGFNQQRGDSVKVINSAFLPPDAMEPLPELPIWKESWFLDLVKQGSGVLLVLVLIFGVLKPTITKLIRPEVVEVPAQAESEDEEEAEAGKPRQLGKDGEVLQLTGKESYEEVLDAARVLINDDPKRVAQLMKQWVAEGGNG